MCLPIYVKTMPELFYKPCLATYTRRAICNVSQCGREFTAVETFPSFPSLREQSQEAIVNQAPVLLGMRTDISGPSPIE